MRESRQDVVVTGMGIVSACGIGLDAFWDALVTGRSGICPITQFDTEGLACKIAGEVSDFDPFEHLDRSLKPKRMGRFTQFALAATRMAVEDAGLSGVELQCQRRLPVVLGVSTNAMDLIARKPGIFTAVASIPNAASSAIASMYELNVRLLTLSNGCASSLDAIAEGSRIIRRGEADVVIAGGADASLTRYVIECLLKTRRCSSQNEHPEKASRPFDRYRDYGVHAEGAGIVILENRAYAKARGAVPYAAISGSASAMDSSEMEEGSGLLISMRDCLANGGIRKEAIDYYMAHGPSDMQMDRTETQVVREALGAHADRVAVTSIKGNVGCPMGAGGAMQLIAGALAMKHGRLPPTANYEYPDPDCDLDIVAGTPRECDPGCILINSHGFGRTNCSLILEQEGSRS